MKSRAGWFGVAAMLVVLFGLARSIQGCGGDDSPKPGNGADASTPTAEGNPRGSGTTSTQTIAAVGGTITVGAVELQFPAGAVPAGTQITVTESTSPAPTELVAVTPVYSFAPEGIVFAKPVGLKITFQSAEANLRVYWSRLNASTNYDPIGTQVESGVAKAQITHFSTGFLGHPKTNAVTPACSPTPCAGATNGGPCSLCSNACDLTDWVCLCVAEAWSCNAKPAAGVVGPVTFNPPSGSYPSAVSLALATTTPEATIRYTLDGSDPVSSSPVFAPANPIALNATTTVKAQATRDGYTSSAIATATYTINPAVAPLTFTPDAGSYAGRVDVAIATDTPNAIIYYTLNGVEPNPTSTSYTGQPIAITATTTLKAYAVHAGYADSAVKSATFTITKPVVAPVTFAPGGGAYTNTQIVTLQTTTTGALIYYTIDGSEPTATAKDLYSPTLFVSETTTVKAFATKSGFTDAAITSATYTFPPIVVAPVDFNPAGGSYAGPLPVALSTATPDAKIYYTVDGSTPTTASSLYSPGTGVTIISTTTLKAFATRINGTDSSVKAATYTIGP